MDSQEILLACKQFCVGNSMKFVATPEKVHISALHAVTHFIIPFQWLYSYH